MAVLLNIEKVTDCRAGAQIGKWRKALDPHARGPLGKVAAGRRRQGALGRARARLRNHER